MCCLLHLFAPKEQKTSEKAKFRKLVLPGDVLKLHVKVIKARSKIWRFQGHAKVNSQLVAESEFTAMMVNQPEMEESS